MKIVAVEKRNTDGYDIFRIPEIICTSKGSLIAYCECRMTGADWAPIDIGMRKSTDGGVTWSERKILVYGKGETVNNPVMFSDKDEITLLYQHMYSRTFVCKSFDDGDTWSEPVEITESLKTPAYPYTVIACGPGHGIVLSNGRYITPVWLALNPEDPKAHWPSIISTIYSDDKGKTWAMGELIQNDFLKNPSETTIVEINQKTMLNIRNACSIKKRAIAYSDDGISGWHDFRYAEELTDPTCAAGMIGVDNKIYFVNCRHETIRTNLTLSESNDFGQTWQDLCLVAENAGYSDIASISPKQVAIYYENHGMELYIAVVDLPD